MEFVFAIPYGETLSKKWNNLNIDVSLLKLLAPYNGRHTFRPYKVLATDGSS